MSTIIRTLAALAAASALLPLNAAAQSSNVINACVGKSLGTMRFTDASMGCRSGETLLSWNVQGPQGPAGPQFSLAASIRGDGTVEALTAPPGAALTVTRVAPGSYSVSVTGLGTGCPLPTATAFHGPTVMWLSAGACGFGGLDIAVNAGNGTDNAFILNVTSQGSATAAASRTTRAAPATTLGR